MSEDKNNEDRIEFEMSTTSTNRNTLVPDVEGVLDAQLAAICVALNQRPSVEPRLTAIAAASQYREKLRKAMARQADEDRRPRRHKARRRCLRCLRFRVRATTPLSPQ